MPVYKSPLYDIVRRGGVVAVFLTLALSTVLNFGGVGIVGVFLAACALASGFRSITDSVRSFDRDYRQNCRGQTYVVFVIYAAVGTFLFFYHRNDSGSIETSLKMLAIAYAVFFHLDDYDVRVVFWGAAVGAILAAIAAGVELFVFDLDRSGGATNPIRFGFLASLFSAISLVGLLFADGSSRFKVAMILGIVAGITAAYLSASRSVFVGLPLTMLPILPRLWRLSRRWTFLTLAALLLIGASLVALDAGSMRQRLMISAGEVVALSQGDEPASPTDGNVRLQMLRLAGDLFMKNPLVGTGERGWANAIGAVAEQPVDFNQAHNQYADDLAKGGLIRFFSGLALLFVPLFLFLLSDPFSNRQETIPAILGLVCCVGFAVFCFVDSIMMLSLSGCVFAALICFLMANNTTSPPSANPR